MNLLTLSEAAARLRVSRATAHRLIHEGVIPVVVLAQRRSRRLLRVREEDLEQALTARVRRSHRD